MFSNFILNCRKASLPATELSAEEVANIIRETYLSAIAKDKRVKVIFKEPFATIENLVKLAKKEPLGSNFNCSSCFK